MGLIGTPVARVEDRLLVVGRGSYVDNLRPPEIADAVHLTFVRSPLAHAAAEVEQLLALGDALGHLGVRQIDMPLTPWTVWKAIRAARQAVD